MRQQLIRSSAIALLLVWPAGTFAQGVAVASQEQVGQIDKRVRALESQVRAVQRKVFDGDKRYFEPEVTAPPAPGATTGTAAASPLVDLTQRVVTLENQQRQLTGQIEQLQHQIRQLQTAQEKFRGDAEFRLDTLEGKDPAQPGTAAVVTPPAADLAPPPSPPAGPGAAESPPPVEKPAGTKPAGDPVEAAYVAGYEKYVAKDYAGAIRDLEAFVSAHPKHARASNARFWAGRAMMAQGQNAQAAKAFLSGYQTWPRGARAHNSLLWLSRSLLAMNQPEAACQALDQLASAYPDRMTGSFATDAANTRKQAKCGA